MTSSFAVAFFTSQALTLVVIQPVAMLAVTVFTFILWPAWLPYIAWIPTLGPMLAGQAAAMLQVDGAASSSLTGRLENLTLVRAAGAASNLPPEQAVVAYGVGAVMSAAMAGVLRAGSEAATGGGALAHQGR